MGVVVALCIERKERLICVSVGSRIFVVLDCLHYVFVWLDGNLLFRVLFGNVCCKKLLVSKDINFKCDFSSSIAVGESIIDCL